MIFPTINLISLILEVVVILQLLLTRNIRPCSFGSGHISSSFTEQAHLVATGVAGPVSDSLGSSPSAQKVPLNDKGFGPNFKNHCNPIDGPSQAATTERPPFRANDSNNNDVAATSGTNNNDDNEVFENAQT